MKRSLSHLVPWFILIQVFVFTLKEIPAVYSMVSLMMIAIYGLCDLYRTQADGGTVMYWSAYGAVVDLILLWKCCMEQQWGGAVICAGILCGIGLLMWKVWKG